MKLDVKTRQRRAMRGEIQEPFSKPDCVRRRSGQPSALTERRASTMATRRTVKKGIQAAWAGAAISCIDLHDASLARHAGACTGLALKARRPVRDDIGERSGLPTTAPLARSALSNDVRRRQGAARIGIPVPHVATRRHRA